MEPTGTTSRPPLILTTKTPVDIVGRSNMQMFAEHMRICFSEHNGEFPESKIKREFSRAERVAIGETLDILAQHGFFVDGIKSNGQIRWAIATKRRADEIFEDGLVDLQRFSRKELSEMARNGFRKIRDRVDVEPVEKWQRDFEEVY